MNADFTSLVDLLKEDIEKLENNKVIRFICVSSTGEGYFLEEKLLTPYFMQLEINDFLNQAYFKSSSENLIIIHALNTLNTIFQQLKYLVGKVSKILQKKISNPKQLSQTYRLLAFIYPFQLRVHEIITKYSLELIREASFEKKFDNIINPLNSPHLMMGSSIGWGGRGLIQHPNIYNVIYVLSGNGKVKKWKILPQKQYILQAECALDFTSDNDWSSMIVNPSGKYLIVCEYMNKRLYKLDLNNLAVIHTWTLQSDIFPSKQSASLNNKEFGVCGINQVAIIDYESYQEKLIKINMINVISCGFEDTELLAGTITGYLIRYNTEKESIVFIKSVSPSNKHINVIQINIKLNFILVGCEDGVVEVISNKQTKTYQTIKVQGWICSINMSFSGKNLIILAKDSILLYESDQIYSIKKKCKLKDISTPGYYFTSSLALWNLSEIFVGTTLGELASLRLSSQYEKINQKFDQLKC